MNYTEGKQFHRQRQVEDGCIMTENKHMNEIEKTQICCVWFKNRVLCKEKEE